MQRIHDKNQIQCIQKMCLTSPCILVKKSLNKDNYVFVKIMAQTCLDVFYAHFLHRWIIHIRISWRTCIPQIYNILKFLDSMIVVCTNVKLRIRNINMALLYPWKINSFISPKMICSIYLDHYMMVINLVM